ncbi:MAG: KAP P-loop [Parcubacteria group bacterium LiPW_15]|nr:MAG: KAP P-loop [Parcubacteria group bacterium LiPW_15]
MPKTPDFKIGMANLTALIKAFGVGVLCSEVVYLSVPVALKICAYIISRSYELEASSIVVSCAILVVGYLAGRGFFLDFVRLIRSARWDIAIAASAGILVDFSFGGFFSRQYAVLASALTIGQIFALLSLPFILCLIFLLKAALGRFKKRIKINEHSFFISDAELKPEGDDLLGFSDAARRFAEKVFNRGSSDSIVFGIDAPWGIGKSSFVNLCRGYWEKDDEYKKGAVVYRFNPLRYEGRSNLLEKFVDGLVRTIQKNEFIPEIRPLISRYSRLIKGRAGFSWSGLKLDFFPGTYTVDDAFDDLEIALSDSKKKVIIIIDDLDRLSFSAIKDVLFVIKKSFTLPNISYVLCYDTDNISALEREKPGVEKVTEFLEKFINVKTSIFLDSATLSNYVSQNLAKALAGNSQADPVLVSKAIGGLIDIYKSKDYHRYLPFIGDVRKLKRLLNTVLLFELEKTDFDNSDFDKHDLIHLLLIYINYPNIFRKIYDSETYGKSGFFSLPNPYSPGYPEDPTGSGDSKNVYKNSTEYTKYIETLTENPRFLLDKVFDASQRLKVSEDWFRKDNFPLIDSVPQEIKSSYACFNGEGGWTGGHNLEEYLNLIVKLSKPQKRNQYRFYLNYKNEIFAGKKIEDVLGGEEFSYSKSESSHEQLWRVVVNSISEAGAGVGGSLILYLLQNIANYSLFTSKDLGLGLRDDLLYFLIQLLDKAGWADPDGRRGANTEENISEIAEWIFGEGRHAGVGVIELLSTESRGVLGLYDLLAFRLFCSADRGGDIFNLQRALSKHNNPTAPTEGVVRAIVIEEMRAMSQKVFRIFKTRFIDPKINLFEVIDSLSLGDLASEFRSFVDAAMTDGKITKEEVDDKVAKLKNRAKSFITYQLGNDIISSGIGCGYYDQSGSGDSHGIRKDMNDYLFETCFNPNTNMQNYQIFLDYLLINFASTFASVDGRAFVANIGEFTKVIDKKRLADYWKANGVAIKALNLPEQGKVVITDNYAATYSEDLPKVYAVLDAFTSSMDALALDAPSIAISASVGAEDQAD